jgi:hypothetical protein
MPGALEGLILLDKYSKQLFTHGSRSWATPTGGPL